VLLAALHVAQQSIRPVGVEQAFITTKLLHVLAGLTSTHSRTKFERTAQYSWYYT